MSLIIKIPGSNFSDNTLPKLYRDGLLNPGSKFLFDFVNGYCNANADGNLNNASMFTNLVEGAPSAAVVTTGSAIQSLAGKAGLLLDGVSDTSYVNLGGSYDLSTTNPSFIVIVWHKIPASGAETVSYSPILKLTQSNANFAQFLFDTGVGGNAPRTQIGWITNGPAASGSAIVAGVGQGVPQQLALHWSPGVVKTYVNGALLGSVTSANINSLFNCAAFNVLISGAYKGTVYRAYQENLTVSGKVAADQILADYNANVGRFS